jgi:hypothetical protein
MSDEKSGLILAPSGQPYKNEKTALDALRTKALDAERYIVVPYLGGWGILDAERVDVDLCHMGKDGKPFKTLKDAQTTAEIRELDPFRWIPAKRGDGYVLIDRPSVGKVYSPTPSMAREQQARSELEYVFVTFDEKAEGSTEPDMVVLSHVNLDLVMQIQRGQKVVVPKVMLALADDTRHAKFSHVQGEGRKVVSWVRRYHYQVHGPATKADWDAYRKLSTAAKAKAREASAPQPQEIMAAGAT